MIAFLLTYWQIMPFRHITPVCILACRLVVYQIFDYIFLNDSIELLEIMFDGRAFHFFSCSWEKLFPNVLDKSPV